MARLFPMTFGTTQVKNFTANTTFPMPAGVTMVKVTGKGGTGQAAYTDPDVTTYRIDKYAQQYSESDQPIGSPFLESTYAADETTPVPANYCGPNFGAGYYCYTHFKETTGTAPGAYHPATTGPSASGFNKTFPGGTGGAATPVTYENVPVTPGTPYSVVVPAGGSITITYIS